MFLLETINFKTDNTGLQNKLRSGSFVSFTVREKIDTNMYRILLSGKLMNVTSSSVLPDGVRMRAQVFWVGKRLRLKVLNKSDPLADLLLGSSIILNNENRMIAEGLVRCGMPLISEYFEKIQQFLRKHKDVDDNLIKVLLLLVDKGIPLSQKNIIEVFSFADRDEQKNLQNWKKDEKVKKNIGKEEIKAVIKKQIKKSDFGNDLLKYYNHKIAMHDNWLIIPLNYSFSRKGIGILKLRLDEKYDITNLVLSLNDGRDWEFNLVNNNKKNRNMKVYGPKEISWEYTDSFRKLKEKLHNIGIQIDDINKELSVTDGFTDISSGKYDSIDFII